MSNIFKLDETIVQTYKYQTKGKSPTEVQHELKAMGIEGFVIRMSNVKVTMKVPKESKYKNRECLRQTSTISIPTKQHAPMLWTGTRQIYYFDTYAKRRVRLLGVDTPERGQDKFKEATAFTRECVEHKDIYVQTYKSDVFGRYLANVWYEDGQRSLNDDLRDAGLLKENSKWNEGQEWQK